MRLSVLFLIFTYMHKRLTVSVRTKIRQMTKRDDHQPPKAQEHAET